MHATLGPRGSGRAPFPALYKATSQASGALGSTGTDTIGLMLGGGPPLPLTIGSGFLVPGQADNNLRWPRRKTRVGVARAHHTASA